MSSTTATEFPHISRATAAASLPSAHMMTGSYRAMVFAIKEMSPWMPASPEPQIRALDGHAIHVRLCGPASCGATKSPAAAKALENAPSRRVIAAQKAAALRNCRRVRCELDMAFNIRVRRISEPPISGRFRRSKPGALTKNRLTCPDMPVICPPPERKPLKT